MKSWWIILALAGVVAGTIAVGCSNDPFDPASLPNERPVAHTWVDHAESLTPTSYTNARFAWSGSDADGVVVGFWISIEVNGFGDWKFTTQDESTATYETDENGRVTPTLRVVAVDDRGALSDTVSTSIPLRSFPPVLKFDPEFDAPPTQSFGAVDLRLFTFDPDGDDTLLPWLEYRYQGSDDGTEFAVDDTTADPTVGWVKWERPQGRQFKLRLRGIPAGSGPDEDQTVYLRVRDMAGADSTISHTWQVMRPRGPVLLVDDDDSDARDPFFLEAAQRAFGDAFNVIDARNLRGESDVFDSTFTAFDAVLWYVRRQGSPDRFEAARPAIERFISRDHDPVAPGTQRGLLYLDYQYAGTTSGTKALNVNFRTNYLWLRNAVAEGPLFDIETLRDQIGDELQIDPGVPTVPVLGYLGAEPPRYFDLISLYPASGTGTLYTFESAVWSDRLRGRPSTPVMATCWPATAPSSVVVMGFQIELATARGTDPQWGNALDALLAIWGGQMGLQLVGGAR